MLSFDLQRPLLPQDRRSYNHSHIEHVLMCDYLAVYSVLPETPSRALAQAVNAPVFVPKTGPTSPPPNRALAHTPVTTCALFGSVLLF